MGMAFSMKTRALNEEHNIQWVKILVIINNVTDVLYGIKKYDFSEEPALIPPRIYVTQFSVLWMFVKQQWGYG